MNDRDGDDTKGGKEHVSASFCRLHLLPADLVSPLPLVQEWMVRVSSMTKHSCIILRLSYLYYLVQNIGFPRLLIIRMSKTSLYIINCLSLM